MAPKITVIIPTFNRSIYLKECLDSILSQTLQPHQVIVVNDGSNDRTREVLDPYLPIIDYVETGQTGKAVALNVSLEGVKGEYVWIFDDDDVALPDALERFVAPLEADPTCGFSYSTYFYTATRPQDDRIGDVLGESRIPDLHDQDLLIPLLESDFLGGASIFARTACYRQVGNFDPALVRSEDYEMLIRLARQFTGVRVAGGPPFHNRQHGGMRGSTRDRFEAAHRNTKWLEYDQLVFRRLYRELPLEVYLPHGTPLQDHLRQAHLQRLAVVASKLMFSEVSACLEDLARLEQHSPFSKQEREILYRLIVRRPFYGAGGFYDNLESFDLIRRLASGSPAMRRFRLETMRVILSHLAGKKRWLDPHSIFGAACRSWRLFI